MPERYFEIIVTGRQLAGLVALVALLVLVAFGLGIGVGLRQERPAPVAVAAAPVWTPVALETVPTVPPTPRSAVPPAPPTPTIVAVEPTPTARVEATAAPAVKPSPTTPRLPLERPGRWVQVAAVGRADLANGVRQRAIALGFRPEQVRVQAIDGKYRVRLGPFPDEESARRVAARLQGEGFQGAFVVRD